MVTWKTPMASSDLLSISGGPHILLCIGLLHAWVSFVGFLLLWPMECLVVCKLLKGGGIRRWRRDLAETPGPKVPICPSKVS
jgi:hypothetical protein